MRECWRLWRVLRCKLCSRNAPHQLHACTGGMKRKFRQARNKLIQDWWMCILTGGGMWSEGGDEQEQWQQEQPLGPRRKKSRHRHRLHYQVHESYVFRVESAVEANGRRGYVTDSLLVIPFFCLCLRSVRLPSIYTAVCNKERSTS